MNDHDERLAQLLSDAVSDVEPTEGLTEIRSRTRPRIPPRRSSRTWWLTVGGSVVATAAVVTAVAVLGGQILDRDSGPGPAEQTSQASDPTPGAAIPVYFVGDTPQGPRLYREFQRSDEAGDMISKAVNIAVSGQPLDPDYRSIWPDGTQAFASYDGDVITVSLETADVGGPELGLHDRPSGMSEDEAALAIQQVIYTAQAALQEGRPGVQFLIDGEPADQVLGVPTSLPLANGAMLETLAQVNITSPEEGATVSGTFTASGVANSFEATVPWEIRRGDEVVKRGFATAEGSMDKLYPWETEVDVSGLAPGEYTFVAMTSDPSGGTEGAGPHVDTRTIVVE